MNINKVILVGNVGKEPEIKTTENGKKVAKISLVLTDKFKTASGETKENTEWYTIIAWGNTADIAERFVKKGVTLMVDGRLSQRSYESNGEKKYITEIITNGLQVVR